MKLPFDRQRMRERNLLDEMDEIEQAKHMTPEERFVATLHLSNLCIGLARGNVHAGTENRATVLEEKARILAKPLQVIVT